MKTDALFYELFQAALRTFFELLQVTPTCAYRFESITVKMSESGEYSANPHLDRQTEERLLAVLAQFIEQKFRSLTYKELRKILRLTPLVETISGQELLKDDRVAMLTKQIQIRFGLSEELVSAVTTDLERLDLDSLKLLIEEILRIETFEQLETWIAAHATPST